MLLLSYYDIIAIILKKVLKKYINVKLWAISWIYYYYYDDDDEIANK